MYSLFYAAEFSVAFGNKVALTECFALIEATCASALQKSIVPINF